MFLATTTVTIYRGTTTSDKGDEVDSDTAVATEIPATIIEQRKDVSTRADNRQQQVGFYTGRIRSTVDVRMGDRLLDERTNYIYIVDNISNIASPVSTNATRLDLRRA